MRRVLLDTSALFASLDADDPNHGRARVLLAVVRRLRISEVFAFDHHFDQMAALKLRRVP